jgi:16S rRNA processing protein RimM
MSMDWSDMVAVGRVARPQGNRGEVVIVSSTDFGEERFAAGAVVHVQRGDAVGTLTVSSSREHDGRWVVGFDGIATIDDAETLRGLELKIPAEDLRALTGDAHYVHDLVGCRVETTAGQTVGVIREVQLGAGIPLLVAEGGGGDVLVPFTEAICRRVDVAARCVVIDAPEGLLELNVTRRGRS